MVEREHDEPIAAILEAAERAILQFDNIARTGPFICQADEKGSSRNEALRGEIGVIVERRRGLLDLLADRLADMRSVVERARDGLGRDPRRPGDVDDRRSFRNCDLRSIR